MKILLTAFDPFGGETINPALEAIKMVSDNIDHVELTKLEIPTIFEQSIEILTNAIHIHKPEAVICIGQAGGRKDITIERVAINIDDARIPDNAGNQPIDQTIRKDGAPAYFSTLPIKSIALQIQKAGIPASISNSAGTFVCNHIMYGLLYSLSKDFPNTLGGFIHVPFIPSQTINRPDQPSMELSDIVKAIEIAIKTLTLPLEDSTYTCVQVNESLLQGTH